MYKNNINARRRKGLEKQMYKSRELESVLLENFNEGMKKEIFGCVYRHPDFRLRGVTSLYIDIPRCQWTISIKHLLMNLFIE